MESRRLRNVSSGDGGFRRTLAHHGHVVTSASGLVTPFRVHL
jgi:hypothetical protein